MMSGKYIGPWYLIYKVREIIWDVYLEWGIQYDIEAVYVKAISYHLIS